MTCHHIITTSSTNWYFLFPCNYIIQNTLSHWARLTQHTDGAEPFNRISSSIRSAQIIFPCRIMHIIIDYNGSLHHLILMTTKRVLSTGSNEKHCAGRGEDLAVCQCRDPGPWSEWYYYWYWSNESLWWAMLSSLYSLHTFPYPHKTLCNRPLLKLLVKLTTLVLIMFSNWDHF